MTTRNIKAPFSQNIPWDAAFYSRSLLFVPLWPVATQFESFIDWPNRECINTLIADSEITSGSGKPLRLISPAITANQASSREYESHCYLTGELETRENNWHDLLNALVWLTFPKTKAALNARHYHAKPDLQSQNKRSRERDSLTLFDEAGVVVVSTDDSLLKLMQNFSWKELFWQRREDVIANMRMYIFGHGLYEQALKPFIGLTGKALLLPIEEVFLHCELDQQLLMLDKKLESFINSNQLKHPTDLSPLPILGFPGMYKDNQVESFYNNQNYFRPGRHARSTLKQNNLTST